MGQYGRYNIDLHFAVQHDGLAFEYVPYSLRTSEMCMEAVKQNGLALQFVQEELAKTELNATYRELIERETARRLTT